MSKFFDADLVTVITPAYNAENIITEAIASVISQTYHRWEMLIVDDCSSDRTAEIVSCATVTDSRVHLIRCQTNGGPAMARNIALAQAKGRWIAFLDSDDIWLPTKLEDTLSYAKEHGSALTFTGYCRVSSDNLRTGGYIAVPTSLTYERLLGNTAIATSTVLIDRYIVGDVLMKTVYYDDFVCWLGILKKGFVAHGLNKDLMRYRIVANSVSRNKWRSAIEVWKIYTQVENLGFVNSTLSFFRYAFNALVKYRSF
jgi:teichuronic acid biosynthesis glycosyltransferase TuaG